MKRALLLGCAVIVLAFGAGITLWCYLPASFLPGYSGRLQICATDIDVMLMEPTSNRLVQAVVDKQECAAIMWVKFGGVVRNDYPAGVFIVADHNTQNFATLHECEIGDKATLQHPDGICEEFVVVQSFKGINTNEDLEYKSGGSILKDNLGGIILYTCVDDTAIPIHVVFLQPVLN